MDASDEELEAMLREAPGNLNFTMFLTMFGERLSMPENRETMLTAFQTFDDHHTYGQSSSNNSNGHSNSGHGHSPAVNGGSIALDTLGRVCMTLGNKLTQTEFDLFIKGYVMQGQKGTSSGMSSGMAMEEGRLDYLRLLDDIKPE